MADQKQTQPEADKNDNQAEELKKKCEEYLNGWKRAKADYLNLKKESEKRSKEVAEFASAATLMRFMPIYNNFKKAFDAGDKKNDSWVQGIEQIKKQFKSLLESIGIKEIKTVGEKFDPRCHEALHKEKKEGVRSDTIITEVEPGYLINGEVLVPAKVIVSE